MSVRSTRSLTPHNVSESVKRGVKSETDDKCWLCKEEGYQVAHMLDKADTLLVPTPVNSVGLQF